MKRRSYAEGPNFFDESFSSRCDVWPDFVVAGCCGEADGHLGVACGLACSRPSCRGRDAARRFVARLPRGWVHRVTVCAILTRVMLCSHASAGEGLCIREHDSHSRSHWRWQERAVLSRTCALLSATWYRLTRLVADSCNKASSGKRTSRCARTTPSLCLMRWRPRCVAACVCIEPWYLTAWWQSDSAARKKRFVDLPGHGSQRSRVTTALPSARAVVSSGAISPSHALTQSLRSGQIFVVDSTDDSNYQVVAKYDSDACAHLCHFHDGGSNGCC